MVMAYIYDCKVWGLIKEGKSTCVMYVVLIKQCFMCSVYCVMNIVFIMQCVVCKVLLCIL